LNYANNDKFEGNWVDDMPNGLGIASSNTIGKYIYSNKDVYEGEWKNGKKEGKGKFSY